MIKSLMFLVSERNEDDRDQNRLSNEKIKLIRRRETFNDFISEEVGLE